MKLTSRVTQCHVYGHVNVNTVVENAEDDEQGKEKEINMTNKKKNKWRRGRRTKEDPTVRNSN